MATKLAAALKHQPITSPMVANAVHVGVFKATLTDGLLAADTLEIGALPGTCQIVRATLASANIAATATFDVGFMSGEPGDSESTRTVGAELFNDAAKNAVATLGPTAAAEIGTDKGHRGIGVKISANETGGATKTITLVVEYVAA
jgi:hypothetical protein